MSNFDIPIFKKAYQLYKEFSVCILNFPRHYKYSLGPTCDNCIIEIIRNIIQASQASKINKKLYLEKTSTELNLLRIYLRLANENKSLDRKKYIELELLVDEIGRMLGGWIRSIN